MVTNEIDPMISNGNPACTPPNAAAVRWVTHPSGPRTPLAPRRCPLPLLCAFIMLPPQARKALIGSHRPTNSHG